jgi:glycerophosphoryl diester phosphodiesterase
MPGGAGVLLAALLLTGCSFSRLSVGLPTAPDQNRTQLDGILCTTGAHRGDSERYLENSPQAIFSARQNPRYAFIEFDVQYCADGTPVVIHDSSLLRLFGHLNSVQKCTAEELRDLSENNIAAFDEIMDLAEGKPLIIEVKSQGVLETDQRLIDYIVADVRRRAIADHILISSISAEAIRYVKTRYPEMATGQVFWLTASTYLPFDFLTEALYQQINESRADYIMLHTANRWNLRDLMRLKPEGKTLVFWNFGDTMYLVHKDPSDRLWNRSAAIKPADLISHHTASPASPIKPLD